MIVCVPSLRPTAHLCQVSRVSISALPVTILWPRAVLAFIAGTVAVGLVTGIPTDVIPNDWFTRMTPVQPYSVPVWATVSLLSGVLAASLWGVRADACLARRGRALGGVGATFSWLAIGCPVCNKLVVLALGTSGALSFFAPLQSWLAGLSVVLLVVSIGWRWRGLLAISRGPVGGHAAGDPA